MVRGFLGHVGGENHFLQFSFMRSDEAKKCLKKIFFFNPFTTAMTYMSWTYHSFNMHNILYICTVVKGLK